MGKIMAVLVAKFSDKNSLDQDFARIEQPCLAKWTAKVVSALGRNGRIGRVEGSKTTRRCEGFRPVFFVCRVYIFAGMMVQLDGFVFGQYAVGGGTFVSKGQYTMGRWA